MIVGKSNPFVITVCGAKNRYWYFSSNQDDPQTGLLNQLVIVKDRLETTYKFSGVVTYRVDTNGVAVIEPTGNTQQLAIQQVLCLDREALPAAFAEKFPDSPTCTTDVARAWDV